MEEALVAEDPEVSACIERVAADGAKLQLEPDWARKNPAIVAAAVASSRLALFFASAELKLDPEMLRLACDKYGIKEMLQVFKDDSRARTRILAATGKYEIVGGVLLEDRNFAEFRGLTNFDVPPLLIPDTATTGAVQEELSNALLGGFGVGQRQEMRLCLKDGRLMGKNDTSLSTCGGFKTTAKRTCEAFLCFVTEVSVQSICSDYCHTFTRSEAEATTIERFKADVVRDLQLSDTVAENWVLLRLPEGQDVGSPTEVVSDGSTILQLFPPRGECYKVMIQHGHWRDWPEKLREDGSRLRGAPEDVRDDFGLVHTAINNYPPAIQWASSRIRNDLPLVTLALQLDGRVLQYLLPQEQGQPLAPLRKRELALIAVLQNGLALEHVPADLQMFFAEIPFNAVIQNPDALQFVPLRLLHLGRACVGPTIITQSLHQDARTLRYVPQEVRQHYVEFAVSRNAAAMEWAPDLIKESFEAMRDYIIRLQPRAVGYASATLQENENFLELVFLAVLQLSNDDASALLVQLGMADKTFVGINRFNLPEDFFEPLCKDSQLFLEAVRYWPEALPRIARLSSEDVFFDFSVQEMLHRRLGEAGKRALLADLQPHFQEAEQGRTFGQAFMGLVTHAAPP
mmetsp:Transcript_64549/g.154205  ORF Transcript_64549/g.154205 Transcript_64549/m.154205 type:complete len:629 (+) Transcript_64549:125-2011(+)